MAGAVAVQVCTAAILRGPGVFGRIATEMASWLAKHGYASPAEVTGLAVRRVVSRPEAPPMLDLSLCNGCGLCEMSCGPDAIHVVEGKAVLDEERCELCGLCVSRCRPGALLWAAPA